MRLCFRAVRRREADDVRRIAHRMSGAVPVRRGNSCLTREGCGLGTRRDRPGSRTALTAAQRSLMQGPVPGGYKQDELHAVPV
jgi:hypothetical protein